MTAPVTLLRIVPRLIESNEPPEVRFADWDIVAVRE